MAAGMLFVVAYPLNSMSHSVVLLKPQDKFICDSPLRES